MCVEFKQKSLLYIEKLQTYNYLISLNYLYCLSKKKNDKKIILKCIIIIMKELSKLDIKKLELYVM